MVLLNCFWSRQRLQTTGVLSYLVVLLFWHPRQEVFLDVGCIDQSSPQKKVEGVLSMGGILKHSTSMLLGSKCAGRNFCLVPKKDLFMLMSVRPQRITEVIWIMYCRLLDLWVLRPWHRVPVCEKWVFGFEHRAIRDGTREHTPVMIDEMAVMKPRVGGGLERNNKSL